MSLLLSLLLSAPAHADAAVVRIDGLNCPSCEKGVVAALSALPFAGDVRFSLDAGGACMELTGALVADAVKASLAAAPEPYTVSAIETVPACPEAFAGTRRRPGPWDGIEGVDVAIVSRGEEVDLAAHAVAGKFTVYDFGAWWCGPCKVTARKLEAALKAQPDLAVRAIDLEGGDAKASFATPAAVQHLAMAPGLPWLVVVDPKGRKVYKGQDVDAALAAVAKRR